jgi:hypothetical protein
MASTHLSKCTAFVINCSVRLLRNMAFQHISKFTAANIILQFGCYAIWRFYTSGNLLQLIQTVAVRLLRNIAFQHISKFTEADIIFAVRLIHNMALLHISKCTGVEISS